VVRFRAGEAVRGLGKPARIVFDAVSRNSELQLPTWNRKARAESYAGPVGRCSWVSLQWIIRTRWVAVIRHVRLRRDWMVRYRRWLPELPAPVP